MGRMAVCQLAKTQSRRAAKSRVQHSDKPVIKRRMWAQGMAQRNSTAITAAV